jgi:hypothetical protein
VGEVSQIVATTTVVGEEGPITTTIAGEQYHVQVPSITTVVGEDAHGGGGAFGKF